MPRQTPAGACVHRPCGITAARARTRRQALRTPTSMTSHRPSSRPSANGDAEYASGRGCLTLLLLCGGVFAAGALLIWLLNASVH